MGDKKKKNNKKDNNKNIIIGIVVAVVIILILLLFLLGNKKDVQYTVTFNSEGGTTISDITIDENGKVQKPADPTKEGYVFEGWYLNGEPFDFDQEVSGNIELEARWTKVSGGNEEDVKVSGVELDKSSLTLNVGDEKSLGVTVSPSNASDKSLVWTSSDSSVVSVDSNGRVTAKKAGIATITVKTNDGGFTDTVKVTVEKEEVEVPEVNVTGVTLNKSTLNLNVGGSSKLTATVKPSNATNKGVTWSSSDKSIATVDANGKVTAKKAGTVTITVTTKDGKYTAECTVKVTEVKVTGVTLNKSTLKLTVGGSQKLTATVKPSNATNKGVTWSSSDKSIATVDSNGKVTAKKAGTVTITVTTKDGKYTAKCTVTVTEKAASYSVVLTPIVMDGNSAINQYKVTVNKNNSALSNYSFVGYNGRKLYKGNELAAKHYNKGVKTATLVLADGSSVTATVVYK